jgi:hypothetical protein
MPAHINPNGKFVVTLWRGNAVHDARTAPTGERALKAAIVMLAELDALEDGDRLTVTEAGGER